MLLNETGSGIICIPKYTLPADLGISDGMGASLQVITIGDSGTALYNVRLPSLDVFSQAHTMKLGDMTPDVSTTGPARLTYQLFADPNS
jgi:hypothetical protein